MLSYVKRTIYQFFTVITIPPAEVLPFVFNDDGFVISLLSR
jgi:hypothetical protein